MRLTNPFLVDVTARVRSLLPSPHASADYKPPESAAKELVEVQIKKNANGLLKLRNFRTLHGVKSNVLGVTLYELHYEAEVEALDHCFLKPPAFLSKPFFAIREKITEGKFLEKGELRKITEVLIYHKTENGWATC